MTHNRISEICDDWIGIEGIGLISNGIASKCYIYDPLGAILWSFICFLFEF